MRRFRRRIWEGGGRFPVEDRTSAVSEGSRTARKKIRLDQYNSPLQEPPHNRPCRPRHRNNDFRNSQERLRHLDEKEKIVSSQLVEQIRLMRSISIALKQTEPNSSPL